VTVLESTGRHRRGDCSTSRASALSFPLFSWLVVVFVVVHVLVFVLVLVLETVRGLPLLTRVTPGP
jgi:disulfide bond formation protein DsbB